MTPHLSYAQVRMGHDGNAGSKSGIIEIEFVGGRRVRVDRDVDVEVLRRVLDLLGPR